MRGVSSRSGMSAEFTGSGTLRRLEVLGQSILLYPADDLEAGPANLYLRRRSGPVGEAIPLLGPAAGGYVRWMVDGPLVTGLWDGLEYRVAFRLAAAVTAWFWQVEVVNRGRAAVEVDLIHAQDVALAPYSAVRTNEYYVSQYLDLTPVPTRTAGTAVAVRQNMPGSGAPWVLLGCLGEAVGWGTDGLQLGRADQAGDPVPGLLADRLPSTRLQHEHTLALLQDRTSRLRPGERLTSGFFGIYRATHPEATSASDADDASEALRQPEARPGQPVTEDAEPEGAAAVVGSLFSSAPVLSCRDLDESEIGSLLGPGRRHVEREDGDLLSFFTDNTTHVVLQAKERAVLRPHGHILRTGNGLVPDEGSLTSTAWMAGVFHSQVTQGHVSLNRLLSTRRGYLGQRRAHGLRIFVEANAAAGRWALLDLPSAWVVAMDSCRWLYRHPDGLIGVSVTAPAAEHELTLRARVLEGAACRLLICANVALGDDDGQDPIPPQLSIDASGVTVRPPPGSATARRFPNGSFRLSWEPGAVELVQGDEALFLDGHSRNLPWLTMRTPATNDFAITLTANLVLETDRASRTPVEPVWPEFWPGLGGTLRLVPPAGSPLAEEVERLDAILPWFAHDALVHYLSPRGLEQYTGGAWGTRDVCQGPVGLLLAIDQTAPVRDLLSRVFRAQNARGDWPQWFEFYPREAAPGQREAHGDVVFWPLLALGEYLAASGDRGFLEEGIPHVGDDGATAAEPVLEHVRRALARVIADTVPGTALPAYGHGDWNDSLQPADPTLAARLCSTWTVTLQVHALRTLADALRTLGRQDSADGGTAALAAAAEQIAASSTGAMADLLTRDGVLAGYGLFSEDGSVEHLVHPSDRRTGLRHGLLQVVHAISGDLLSPEDARAHLALLDKHLLGPDGARLFDRPVRYHGGPMEVFKRAEAATFFGREIGIMYMHAHLRYAEALARHGDARQLLAALALANPIGMTARVPSARSRQSTCYYSSSDAVFADRYEAADHYDAVLRGEVALEGGWRVYSSGPGIFLRLIFECLLGLRRRPEVLEVDPVLAPELDGLRARVPVAGLPLDVTYRVGARGVGPLGISLNGVKLGTRPLVNPYRPPGVAVDMAEVRAVLRKEGNSLAVEVS
jgi:1,2-beta-oligoglucan phosphorylase